jgi:hypothetical protein
MERAIIRDFNLPLYVKGKTFAEASEAIEKKFDGRNDKVSIDTKQELLDRLADAQEHIREIMEAQENPNQFDGGGQSDPLSMAGSAASMLGPLGSLAGAGATTGAAAGAGLLGALGPIGAGVGILAPIVSNLLSKPSKQEQYESMVNQLQSGYTDLRSDFGMGGKTNDYAEGSFLSNLFGNPDVTSTIGGALRFAPVISNFMQSKQLEPAVTPRGNRVAAQYDKQLFDPNQIINRINQNNLSGALSEASGGDLGALRSNLLAGSLNRDKAIADAILQGDQVNRQENQFEFDNRMRRDLFNTQLDERYLERAAQDQGAYNTALSQFQSAIGTDIGNIGKEIQQKELMKKMFGYDWLGRYLQPNQNAYGGPIDPTDPIPAKKIAQDPDSVIVTKPKKYNVSFSKLARLSHKDGRMRAAAEKQMEKDIKAAGGLEQYLQMMQEGRRKVLSQRKRRK